MKLRCAVMGLFMLIANVATAEESAQAMHLRRLMSQVNADCKMITKANALNQKCKHAPDASMTLTMETRSCQATLEKMPGADAAVWADINKETKAFVKDAACDEKSKELVAKAAERAPKLHDALAQIIKGPTK